MEQAGKTQPQNQSLGCVLTLPFLVLVLLPMSLTPTSAGGEGPDTDKDLRYLLKMKQNWFEDIDLKSALQLCTHRVILLSTFSVILRSYSANSNMFQFYSFLLYMFEVSQSNTLPAACEHDYFLFLYFRRGSFFPFFYLTNNQWGFLLG